MTLSTLSILMRKGGLGSLGPATVAIGATVRAAAGLPVAPVARIAGSFNRDTFEERAAIMEHDGGLSRDEAERLAAMGQGYTLAQARRSLN